MKPEKAVFGLDLIRAIAIALVVISHADQLLPSSYRENVFFTFFGFAGVELFFVLSGFLIGQILIRAFDDFQGLASLRKFWIRRWMRTLPNYYLFLFGYVIFLAASNSHVRIPFLRYSLFLQNFHRDYLGVFGESWSLSVEEWFYFLFPLTAAVFFRITKAPKKALIWSGVAIASFSILSRAQWIYQQPEADWRYVLRKIVILRLDAICFGVMMAITKSAHPRTWDFLKKFSFLFAAPLIAFSALAYRPAWHSPVLKVIILSSLAGGFVFLLPFSDRGSGAGAFWKKIVTSTSRWSYSMYLCNQPVKFLILFLLPAAQNPSPTWLGIRFLFFLFACAFVSWAIFTGFEKPILRLRDRALPDH